MIQNLFLFFSSASLSLCFMLSLSSMSPYPIESGSSVVIVRSISLRKRHDVSWYCHAVVLPSYSGTHSLISHYPRDRYYPSPFPRYCRLPYTKDAVSEKPSSSANFHFLILAIVFDSFLSFSVHFLVLSSLFPRNPSSSTQDFPQTTVESHNERESQGNCPLNNWESSRLLQSPNLVQWLDF